MILIGKVRFAPSYFGFFQKNVLRDLTNEPLFLNNYK